MIMFGDFAFI